MSKLLYVLALLVTGYASIFYDAMYLRAIFMMLLLLPIILYGIVRYQKKNLTIRLAPDVSLARKRTPFNIQIAADNDCKVPISRLDIQLAFKNEFSPFVGKVRLKGMADNESVTYINYNITSDYCGRLSIQTESLKIYDMLGLTFCRLDKPDIVSLIVMPEIHDMDIQVRDSTRAFPISSEEYDPHRSGDDVSEVFDFREYVGGDQINRINWKLSTKSNELIVKEFSHPVGYSVVLLLDFSYSVTNRPQVPQMDGFLETAASLSNSILNASCYHYISWYSQKQKTLVRKSIKSEEDLLEMLPHLLVAEPYKDSFNLADLYHTTYIYDIPCCQLILDLNLTLKNNEDEKTQFQPEQLSHSLMNTSILV